MRFWWVNQNQTHRQEFAGGYLWSPKRNASGARNPYYDSMREVAPGDLIFSFVDTRIDNARSGAIDYSWNDPNLVSSNSSFQYLGNFDMVSRAIVRLRDPQGGSAPL